MSRYQWQRGSSNRPKLHGQAGALWLCSGCWDVATLWSVVRRTEYRGQREGGGGVDKEAGQQGGRRGRERSGDKILQKELEKGRVYRGVQQKERHPQESYRLTPTVSSACPQTQESSHRKSSTGCSLCRDRVMLQSVGRASLRSLISKCSSPWIWDSDTSKRAFACVHTHTHPDNNNNNCEKDVGAIICIARPWYVFASV